MNSTVSKILMPLLIPDFYSEKMLWIGSAIGMVFVATFIYGTLWIIDYIKLEKVIPYTISAPNPPGDGRVLERPSIKVPTLMLILLRG
jgi:hypothetical protein